MPAPRRRGFSLVEMAIVLVIVGLMIGGLLVPLGMQVEQRKISETQRVMEETREALIGFALRNGYLPCPAISASNGLEHRIGRQCAAGKRLGFVPWATLGVPKLDAWNHLFLYSVTPAFSNSGQLFGLATRRDISISTRDSNGNLVAATAPSDIPAVIMSYGKNAEGAISEQGQRAAGNSRTNVDERVNANGGGFNFISRGASENSAARGGEFDDLVSWISPNILYNRMVTAQKLP